MNYDPKIARLIGSIDAAIILKQIIDWYSLQYTSHVAYTPFQKPLSGRGGWYEWANSVGMTQSQFTTALSKIATKTTASGDDKLSLNAQRTHSRTALSDILSHTKPAINSHGRMTNAPYLVYYYQDGLSINYFAINATLASSIYLLEDKPMGVKEFLDHHSTPDGLPQPIIDAIKDGSFIEYNTYWQTYSTEQLLRMASTQFKSVKGSRNPSCLYSQLERFVSSREEVSYDPVKQWDSI
jgi:hypothetical protein